MKKFRQTVFTILLLTAFSSVSFALVIYPELKFIGFSENGKYLAFEESGEIRGLDRYSNYDYAVTYYVDAAKNSFALAPTHLYYPPSQLVKFNSAKLEAPYKKEVSQKLRKLRIKSGNTGDLVVAHFLTDWSFVKPVERESNIDEDDESEQSETKVTDYVGGYGKIKTTEIEKAVFTNFLDSVQATDWFFELTLIPSLAKSVPGCSENYKFELTLKRNIPDEETKLQILQKDSDIVPENRLCPLGYKIERVYVYEKNIAVFLNVFSKDLEDPEVGMNYMVVSGVISHK